MKRNYENIFQTDFHRNLQEIFSMFFRFLLKCSILGITPAKITEILRNSEKNRRIVHGKKKQNLRSPLKMHNIALNFAQNGANVLKNYRNLEWCEGRRVDLVKSFQTSIYLQNLASIQQRTSLRTGPKNVRSKAPFLVIPAFTSFSLLSFLSRAMRVSGIFREKTKRKKMPCL